MVYNPCVCAAQVTFILYQHLTPHNRCTDVDLIAICERNTIKTKFPHWSAIMREHRIQSEEGLEGTIYVDLEGWALISDIDDAIITCRDISYAPNSDNNWLLLSQLIVSQFVQSEFPSWFQISYSLKIQECSMISIKILKFLIGNFETSIIILWFFWNAFKSI